METVSRAATGVTRSRTPRPRADALRNRERIVTAAREMFVEFGPDVPLDEVARRAAVGNATLYRNFPDRAALVHEVVLAVTSRTTDRAEEAAAEESDPFAALSRFVHAAADERIGALCPMLSGGFDKDHPELLAERRRLEEAVEGSCRAPCPRGDCAPTSPSVTYSSPSPSSPGRCPAPAARTSTGSPTVIYSCSWTALRPRPGPNCPERRRPWRTCGAGRDIRAGLLKREPGGPPATP